MQGFNPKSFIMLFLLLLTSFAVNAQVKDSLVRADAIIRVDGTIIYGKVVEVDQQYVKYRINDLVKGPVITLPRKLVYAISYSNNTTLTITPAFGKKKIDMLAFDQSAPDNTGLAKDTIKDFGFNIGHGSLKLGMSFSRPYSGFKNISTFDKTDMAPALFGSYHFRFNRFLTTGVNMGYANFNYSYHSFSSYDQLEINQNMNEKILTFGFLGRFNLMDGFIKPYLLAGVNINHSECLVVNDIFFIDQGRHIATVYKIRGFNSDFVFRGGVDIMLSKSFGLYSDIGLGSSLLQIGAIFSFK